MTTRPPARAAGFTLIEVLIVLAIILMISGLVAVQLFSRRDRADIDQTRINLNTLRDALDAFRFDFRRYPTDEEGLAVLWDKAKLDAEADAAAWAGYLQEPLESDVWGNAWGYAAQSEDFEADEDNPSATAPFDLWSNGPDGEEGTDDDIRSGRSAAGEEAEGPGGDLAPPQGP